jgi:hypothetical protein
MKKLFLFICAISISLCMYSQVMKITDDEPEKTASITVGILQGGGSLIGADLEKLLSRHIGAQVGAGYSGFGGGINYHLTPSIRSSFVSVQYWHQGIGNRYAQSMFGPSFVYRAPRWFTAQIGLGYVLGYGPNYPSSAGKSPVILLYSIGAYFPL